VCYVTICHEPYTLAPTPHTTTLDTHASVVSTVPGILLLHPHLQRYVSYARLRHKLNSRPYLPPRLSECAPSSLRTPFLKPAMYSRYSGVTLPLLPLSLVPSANIFLLSSSPVFFPFFLCGSGIFPSGLDVLVPVVLHPYSPPCYRIKYLCSDKSLIRRNDWALRVGWYALLLSR